LNSEPSIQDLTSQTVLISITYFASPIAIPIQALVAESS
jgi:hypothetical protein